MVKYSSTNIHCKVADIKKISEFIIYTEIKDVKPIPDKAEAKEYIDTLLDIANHKPFLLLTDISKVKYTNWTSEAKEYVAKHEEYGRLCKYNAVVIKTLPIKLLFQLYVSFFKPKVSTKVYDEYSKALSVLKRKEKLLFNPD